MRNVLSTALIVLLVCIFHLCETASGEDRFSPYVENFSDGRIDWDNGIIFGVGKGYLHRNGGSKQNAFRAAQVTALQSILKIASGLRLNDRETLEKLDGGRIALQLRGLIRFQEAGHRFVEDAEHPYFEVTRKASLKGIDGLTAKLLDHFKSTGIAWEKFPQAPLERETETETETWLVLDARGEEIAPALFPRILDENGEVIYDVGDVRRASLEEQGMSRYVVSDLPLDRLGADRSAPAGLIERILSSFAGPSTAFAEEKKKAEEEDPGRRRKRRKYVVKDVKAAEGLMKTNLVISESDARDLKQADASSKILKKCRVIIVVNSPLGGVEGALDSAYYAGVVDFGP